MERNFSVQNFEPVCLNFWRTTGPVTVTLITYMIDRHGSCSIEPYTHRCALLQVQQL